MNKLIASQLQLNAWVAVLIGTFVVFDPISMLSTYGLHPDISPALMSELRAPGGLLILCGLAIVRCALAVNYYETGLKLSMMLYGGYGLARLISVAIDGKPAVEIVLATTIEISLLLLSGLALWRLNGKPDLALTD